MVVSKKTFFVLFFIAAGLFPLRAGDRPRTLLDSASRGVFNIGESRGKLSLAPDAGLKRNVLQLDFDAPESSVVGVWSKGYGDLGAATANFVTISVKTNDGNPANVTVVFEVKGDKGGQRIPVPLKAGWSASEAVLDWARIGDFAEAVFVVSPVGGARRGTLWFDAAFGLAPRAAAPAASGFGLTQAGAKGIFTMKGADGKVAVVPEGALRRDVLKFDYAAPAGSAVGVWTKNFPAEWSAGTVNGVKVALLGTDLQSKQVAVSLEIKGSKDTQKIPVPVQSEWAPVPHRIDWARVGSLQEAVGPHPRGGPSERNPPGGFGFR
ncbi:MAG: hypothetical protein IPP35_02615 [Elusimicrobia bacterium]|nr:hypothetical protein [Elusimicrobiota bacterium]